MASIRDVIKGSVTYAIVPISTALLTLFVVPVVSYVYPTAEYGKINLFYTVGSLGMSMCLLGFDYFLMRFYHERERGYTPAKLFTVAFAVGVSVDVLVSLALFLLARSYASEILFGQPDPAGLVCLSIYIACLVTFRLLNTMARMRGNAMRYNIQSVLQNVITRASFVLIAWYSTSYQYALLIMTGGMLLATLYFSVAQRKDCFSLHGLRDSKSMFFAGLAFGVPCMLDALAVTLNASIGKLVLSAYGMFDMIGVLAIATTLSTAFSMIPQAFGTYWAPFMYEHYKTERDLIKEVHECIMLLSLVIVVLIFCLQDVLFLLVGGEYRAGQSFFMLLMLGPVQSLICETTHYGIMLENKPILGTVATLGGVVVCAVLTVALAPSLGAYGAAIATAASAVVIGVSRSVIGYRLYPSVGNWKRTVACASLILFVCVSNSFIYQDLAAKAVLVVAVMGVGLFLCRNCTKGMIVAAKRVFRR